MMYSIIKKSVWQKLVKPIMQLRDAEIVHIVSDTIPLRRGGSLLDLGCGDGRLCTLLARRFSLLLTGIDIISRTVDFPFVRAQAEFLPFKASSFHIVTAFSLLEHIPLKRRVHFLTECRRVLTSDGLLIVQIPNRYFPIEQHTFLPFLGFFPGRIQSRLFGSYCDVPSTSELKDLMKAGGFDLYTVVRYRFPSLNKPTWARVLARIPIDFGYVFVARP